MNWEAMQKGFVAFAKRECEKCYERQEPGFCPNHHPVPFTFPGAEKRNGNRIPVGVSPLVAVEPILTLAIHEVRNPCGVGDQVSPGGSCLVFGCERRVRTSASRPHHQA